MDETLRPVEARPDKSPRTGQARQKPQRGGGKPLSRGPQAHSVCAEIETLMMLRRRKRAWGGVSPHHPTRDLEARHKLPSEVRGGAPAENGFYAYFRLERSRLEQPFSTVERWRGPPDVAGPRKTSPSRWAWNRSGVIGDGESSPLATS